MKQYGFNFNTTYTQLPHCFYQNLAPTPVKSPELVILNTALASSLDLDFSALTPKASADLFSGNFLPDKVKPFAQAYAGHQYGHFTMLGDGRALVWGEHITSSQERFDIQFKGSGQTPYSRQADGRAALGPMLREYLLSEAMYNLGIPTTRSLAVVKTGESLWRESWVPGGILTRVASSHLRVGTIEFAAAQQDQDLLKQIVNYTIDRHYPQYCASEQPALDLLRAVMLQQIDLIVHWMRVGFIHGVMNTDNMTLSGETIDYGPCAFMDSYNPNTVFSSIDQYGRYAYANQPRIAQWNLAKLAEALLPLIAEKSDQAIHLAESIISEFPRIYETKWLTMMRTKLGLDQATDSETIQHDQQLITDLFAWMQNHHMDYTNTFRALSQLSIPQDSPYLEQPFQSWQQRWQTRLDHNKSGHTLDISIKTMQANNPAIIPRNHQVERALVAAEQDNFTLVEQLLAALKQPYIADKKFEQYYQAPLPNERVYQTFCGT